MESFRGERTAEEWFPIADGCRRVDFSGGGGGSALSSMGVRKGSCDSDCEDIVGAGGSSAVEPLLMVNDKERGTDLRFRRL